MEKNKIKTLVLSHPTEISKLYYEYRDVFLSFGKKYGLGFDDLSDIYQEAFIALRKHAISGKLDTVKSTLKTYLFGIGKFMIFDRLKEKSKTSSYEPSLHIANEIESVPYVDTTEKLTVEQRLLHTFFKKLGKKCQEMLTLFYSRGLSIDDIVEFTDYTSNSVVRSQKSRCLKTLKEMIKP